MTKAMFINGSPRQKWNTAQLLERAMQGASDASAEVELGRMPQCSPTLISS